MASSMTMAMSSTGTAAAATSTSTMDMSSMDSSMDMGGDCKVSMLWNWYTIDACFLAKSWHITSRGMFAGSCIGVILMVMLLEFLRRTAKEYDRLLLRQHQRAMFAEASSSGSSTPQRTPVPEPEPAPTSCCDGADSIESEKNDKPAAAVVTAPRAAAFPSRRTTRFRPNVMQQAIRALLHLLQFALAYFVMLLAMYYNGYLIICIFIGAFLGAFIFSWESVEVTIGGASGMEVEEDPTVCCG
ncbi:Copper transport protein ctr4 [Lasiodiplodia theobromae]|uniref:Copper transport protein n=1 Tax=Lasiodiplodia theobromae TaxID=45133 RepID=A0A5N5DM38_9PEZI|nr:Copper transport protein ctr4 [Lasiodiplodia theobromae]